MKGEMEGVKASEVPSHTLQSVALWGVRETYARLCEIYARLTRGLEAKVCKERPWFYYTQGLAWHDVKCKR